MTKRPGRIKVVARALIGLSFLVATLSVATSPASASLADWTWPTAATTGVPAGTALSARTGVIRVTTPGTVIDGVDLNGCVEVLADNVTIRRSRITCGNSPAAVRQFGGRSGLLVEDSEIIGTPINPAGAGIWAANPYTARRVEIRGTDDGAFVASGTVIQDSWIHSLHVSATAHNDLIQMVGGTGVAILNNRLEHRADQTSAIMIKADLGPISDVAIGDNLISGGIYSVYIHEGPQGMPTNVRVANNVFIRGSSMYGPMYVHGSPALACNVHDDRQAVSVVRSSDGHDRFANPC